MKLPYPQEVAVIWFPDEAEYQQYQQVCVDEMRPYAQWRERAERMACSPQPGGPKIIKVYANASAFVTFCSSSKIQPDANARSVFAAFLLRNESGRRN